MVKQKRILVADMPAGVEMIRGLIGAEMEVIGANSLAEAMSLLNAMREGGVSLVLCGLNFDESRMYDLLRMVKANPSMKHIPFVCFCDLDSKLANSIQEGIQIACTALGAEKFIDLCGLKMKLGKDEANGKFRNILQSYLN